MKKILFLLTCIAATYAANGQKTLLALDENDKYIYYQVVDQPNASRDSLDRKAMSFNRGIYKKGKAILTGDSVISIKDKMLTYSVLAFVKHESGIIKYTLTIECKDRKYRYWFTDFVFTPYYKDRYGNFVPQPGIAYSLEKAAARLDKKELDEYLDQTGAYCKQTGDGLKAFMSQNHLSAKAGTQPVKKIIIKKW